MSAPQDPRSTHLRGDGPCQDCGASNIVWHAPSVFWNAVMAPPGEFHHGDPGGIVCVVCFVRRAEERFGVTGWELTPEWPWVERVSRSSGEEQEPYKLPAAGSSPAGTTTIAVSP